MKKIAIALVIVACLLTGALLPALAESSSEIALRSDACLSAMAAAGELPFASAWSSKNAGSYNLPSYSTLRNMGPTGLAKAGRSWDCRLPGQCLPCGLRSSLRLWQRPMGPFPPQRKVQRSHCG